MCGYGNNEPGSGVTPVLKPGDVVPMPDLAPTDGQTIPEFLQVLVDSLDQVREARSALFAETMERPVMSVSSMSKPNYVKQQQRMQKERRLSEQEDQLIAKIREYTPLLTTAATPGQDTAGGEHDDHDD